MRRRVVITGCGVVCALGRNRTAFARALAAGRSGVVAFDVPASTGRPFPVPIAAVPASQEPAGAHRRTETDLLDRVSRLAMLAATEAVDESGLAAAVGTARDAGVFIGTAMGGAASMERAYADMFGLGAEPRPFTVLSVMHNAPASHISMRFGLKGPNVTVSSACASSSHAIGQAFHLVRAGELSCAVAGGSEANLVPGVLRAWKALRVLAPLNAGDPARSCRPFSADRAGIVLGEGAAIIVLESLESARARGAEILAELQGYGRSADAVHLTNPSVEGQARAMADALADAKLEPDEIDYINAHGTATLVGDLSESLAIKRVFGEHAKRMAVSSTKSAHGHLLGAAGAVELAACLSALEGGFAPATLNLSRTDPECDLDYVPNVPRSGVRLRRFLTNSFAFGGSNAVLIGGAYRD